MNTMHNRTKSVTAAFGLAVVGAAASVLLSLGAGVAQAGEFDPQPDPPGQARGFNPQPEPPTRQFEGFNSSSRLNVPPSLRGVNAGH